MKGKSKLTIESSVSTASLIHAVSKLAEKTKMMGQNFVTFGGRRTGKLYAQMLAIEFARESDRGIVITSDEDFINTRLNNKPKDAEYLALKSLNSYHDDVVVYDKPKSKYHK